jgi:hypothetical protein
VLKGEALLPLQVAQASGVCVLLVLAALAYVARSLRAAALK